MGRSFCSDEFKCKNFGLGHENPYLFVTPQCGPAALYPVWALCWFGWHLGVVIQQIVLHTDRNDGANFLWLKYLTNWSYLLLTLSSFVDAVISLRAHCCARHLLDRSKGLKENLGTLKNQRRLFDDKSYAPWPVLSVPISFFSFLGDSMKDQLPWYLKIHWVLFTTSTVAALFVTIGYYFTLGVVTIQDMEEVDVQRNALTFGGIAHHAINSVYVLLLLLYCAKPFRLLHAYMTSVYLLLWSVFALIYQHVTDDIIYEAYDWFDPKVAIGAGLVAILIIIPIFHSLVFLLVQLRIYICTKCCGTRKVGDSSRNVHGAENVGMHI